MGDKVTGNNNVAVLCVIIGAISYGTLGIISVLAAQEQMSPFFLAFLGKLFATAYFYFACLVMSKFEICIKQKGIFKKRKKSKFTIRKIQKLFFGKNEKDNTYDKKLMMAHLVQVITKTDQLFLVLGFFFVTNKLLGGMIYEIYPILAVIVGYSLTGFFSHKIESHGKDGKIGIKQKIFKWFSICVKQTIFKGSSIGVMLLLSLMGVILLSATELIDGESTSIVKIISSIAQIDWASESSLGIIFLMIGAALSSIGTVFSTEISGMIEENCEAQKGGEGEYISHSEIAHFARIISNIPAIIILFFIWLVTWLFPEAIPWLAMDNFSSNISLFANQKVLMLVFAYAFFLEIVVGLSISYAGLNKPDSSIYVMWFLAPITSIFLLWFTGYGNFTSIIGLGMILILVPNLVINIKLERSPSYKWTVLWLATATYIIFSFEGFNFSYYFDIMTVLLVFFPLIIAFLTDRIVSLYRKEEEIFIDLLESIRDVIPAEYISKLLNDIHRKENHSTMKDAYNKIIETRNPKIDYKKLNLFYLLSLKGINIAELYVLGLISGFSIFILIAGRGTGFVFDMIALILSTAIVYLALSIRDIVADRREKIIEYNSASLAEYKITYEPVRSSSLAGIIVGIIVLLVIIFSTSVVLLYKWDWQFTVPPTELPIDCRAFFLDANSNWVCAEGGKK